MMELDIKVAVNWGRINGIVIRPGVYLALFTL